MKARFRLISNRTGSFGGIRGWNPLKQATQLLYMIDIYLSNPWGYQGVKPPEDMKANLVGGEIYDFTNSGMNVGL